MNTVLSDAGKTVTPQKTLRRLFLTLFLRGRGARGLQKSSAPKSVGSKLSLVLILYGAMGFFALFFLNQGVFALSLYLHAMTLVFLGMFVASSSGEVLFNSQEADILMHRPITPKALLWAKISVLLQVSVWMAGAFNLAGLFVGVASKDGGWFFPVAHAFSTVMEALFCTGIVVLAYQLCLRWFGRERLDGLMTTTQVIVAVAAVLGGQLAPQLIRRIPGDLHANLTTWWIWLLPPAWFAGFDDLLAGSRNDSSLWLCIIGLLATLTVLWLSFGRLARDYELGLQSLNETVSTKPKRKGQRRWADRLVAMPPLCWWLRDSVSRASFLLTVAYLFRDRDVKLRVYPGLAPMLVLPAVMIIQSHNRADNVFGLALSGVYLAMVPTLAMQTLSISQQWQAADLFRVAPIQGPAPLSNGVRRAVLGILTVPLMILLGVVIWFMDKDLSHLLLLLPGMIVMPVFAMAPWAVVPLSRPPEEAKSANRGLSMIGIMLVAVAMAAIVSFAWSQHWFTMMLAIEAVVCAGLYVILRLQLEKHRWKPIDD